MSADKNLPPLPDGVTLEELLVSLRAALETCHDTDWSLRQFKTSISHALAALAQQAQPVYQVRGAFSSDPVNTWRDATETAFYFHPVNQRRILYATPPAPQTKGQP